MLKLSLFEG